MVVIKVTGVNIEVKELFDSYSERSHYKESHKDGNTYFECANYKRLELIDKIRSKLPEIEIVVTENKNINIESAKYIGSSLRGV